MNRSLSNRAISKSKLRSSIALVLICTGCVTTRSLEKTAEEHFPINPNLIDDDSSQKTKSLAKSAEGHFPIGVSISPKLIDDDASQKLISSQFSIVTPENCMKFPYIQSEEGIFDFERADKIVEFAEENDLLIVGHCLLWANDSSAKPPEWLFRDGDDVASPELLFQRLKNHIDALVGRYKGRIREWDVVNEALADGDEYLRSSKWFDTAGEEVLVKAFQYAHAADPDAMLVYNDYNNELPDKREKMIRLVKMLKQRGAPIHAIGMQGHYNLDSVPFKEIESTLNTMRELGMKVVVSELDIDMIPRNDWWADGGIHREEMAQLNPYPDVLPEDIAQRQAEQYAQLFTLFKAHADVIERITFWNLHDGQSWLNHFPWKRVNHPLLFDRDRKPKPAYHAVIEVFEDSK